MIPEKKSGRTINSGDTLVERNTLLPDSLRLETDSAADGWARVADSLDGHELQKRLATAGWTFFYMAGTITASGFGAAAALKRLITAVRLQKCNCVEIDDIRTRSLFGVPYVSLSAHSRHIQSGRTFAGTAG
jgi:hypothetical protein